MTQNNKKTRSREPSRPRQRLPSIAVASDCIALSLRQINGQRAAIYRSPATAFPRAAPNSPATGGPSREASLSGVHKMDAGSGQICFCLVVRSKPGLAFGSSGDRVEARVAKPKAQGRPGSSACARRCCRVRSPQHHDTLLLRGLHAHEAHGRPRHRFADRLRICRVVLAALHVGIHVLRRHRGKNSSTRLRDNFCRRTACPAASTPCTRKTDFAGFFELERRPRSPAQRRLHRPSPTEYSALTLRRRCRHFNVSHICPRTRCSGGPSIRRLGDKRCFSANAPNVKALVLVDAFAPDAGESVQFRTRERSAAAVGFRDCGALHVIRRQ